MELVYSEEAQKIFNKYWNKKWYDGIKIKSMTKQAAKDFAVLEVSSMIVELSAIEESLSSESGSDWWYKKRVDDRITHYEYIIREIENI